MENLIYNELRMRGYGVDVGVVPVIERDLQGKAIRKQEIRPFRKIDDSFKKIVITRDIVPRHYDGFGILTMNIYDFLADMESIEK